MRSFFVRIFLSFWSIIVITIVAAGALGYIYAERARDAMQSFEVSDAMYEASEALDREGRAGLSAWLRSLPGVTASLVYVVDERGHDLLDRRLPPPVAVAMRRFGRPHMRRPSAREFGNLRPARPFTELVGPDDEVYTLFVLPPQGVAGRWLLERGGAVFVILALVVSATISYLLARAISRPIRRFRESAIAIADGDLDTRVRERVGHRRDEIGLLAADFDRMTDELQRTLLRQAELTQNVSHELRSPLARLRVALELARRRTGELPELEKIDLETERLDELIGQILEYSRLDAPASDTRERIDLDELLRSIVADASYEFGRGGSRTRFEYQGDASASTFGYPGALRSAIENVLRNAAQHQRGEEAVQLRLDVQGSEVVITVEDHGGGVADHELERLFEPFYRARARRPDAASPGTGLGLAIAARAIRLNDGSFSARNTGRGLSMEIRLPLAATADPPSIR